jgi:hypothetical protein
MTGVIITNPSTAATTPSAVLIGIRVRIRNSFAISAPPVDLFPRLHMIAQGAKNAKSIGPTSMATGKSVMSRIILSIVKKYPEPPYCPPGHLNGLTSKWPPNGER